MTRTHCTTSGFRRLLVALASAIFGLALRAPAATGDDVAPAAVRGRWVLDGAGNAVAPRAFERGLQTSGLVFFRGELWSVGDQRSEFPGHLFRLDPRTGRLLDRPLRVTAPEDVAARPAVADYLSIRNPDFEGLARHPRREDTLLVVTEDKRQTLIEVRIDAAAQMAAIRAITEIDFPPGLAPYRDDPNYRLEGITASPASGRIYLAYERAADGLPSLWSIDAAALESDAARASGKASPRRLDIDFAAVAPRADKDKSLLNLNGLDILAPRAGAPARDVLVAVARDQERILTIDPEAGKVLAVVDLDLRSPAGERILWVSPEGLAADPASDRLWIINDPDSIRGNYRRLADPAAAGRFAMMAPLLFELALDDHRPKELR